MKSSPRDESLDLIDKLTRQMREHVDTVQVFITIQKDDERETSSYEVGFGNFLARKGHVQQWINMQNQYEKNYATRKDNEEDEE